MSIGSFQAIFANLGSRRPHGAASGIKIVHALPKLQLDLGGFLLSGCSFKPEILKGAKLPNLEVGFRVQFASSGAWTPCRRAQFSAMTARFLQSIALVGLFS